MTEPITPIRTDLVAAVRHYAKANYTAGGWDYVVECWDDSDILKTIGDAQTVDEAIAEVRTIVKIIAERERDIQAGGGW